MRRIIAACVGLAAFSACASFEPEPCSAEWVEWKTDRVLGSFAAQNRRTINELIDFSGRLEDPGPLVLFQMATRLDDFQALAENFEADVMPELKSAIDQCGTPDKFIPAFTGFLRKEGVAEDMLIWIYALGSVALEQS